MKFVLLQGGLGNQMFNYAFCLEMRQRGYNTVLFLNQGAKKYGHYGFELNSVFKIQKYQNVSTIICAKILYLYFVFIKTVSRITTKNQRAKLLKAIGIEMRTVPENFIYYPEIFNENRKNELYAGTWQSEKFFSNSFDIVRKTYRFDENAISVPTKKILGKIEISNSISIHIRRGDYLKKKFYGGFAEVCNMEYYKNAINHINNRVDDPVYYIFSDDQKWVEQNFSIEKANYITHNRGMDSWQDIFLMSKCKHNIIANSSFSWWGAWLNQNPDKTIVAPKKWWSYFEHDDVVPDNWIRI